MLDRPLVIGTAPIVAIARQSTLPSVSAGPGVTTS